MPAPTRFLPLMTAVLMCAAAGAVADVYNWQGAGTGGNTATDPADPTTLWSNPANWLEGTVPGDEDTAYIPFANAGHLNAETATVQSLYADGDSRKGVFQIPDGVDFTVSNTAYVGYAKKGWVIQDGGTHTVGQSLYIGYEEKSEGTYELRNGNLSVLGYDGRYGNTSVGAYGGEGAFVQSGGNHTARALGLSDYSTYDLAAGDLIIADGIYLGDRALFTQTGGACRASTLHLPHQGRQTAAGGTYRLSGGSLLTDEEDLDQGAFEQSGGTHTVGYLGVGRDARFTITGGTLSVLHGLGGEGTLDLGGTQQVIDNADLLVNLSEVTLLNAERTSLHLGQGSLLVIPAAFDPSQAFQSYSNLGMTHVAGTTLVVDADQAVRGWGEIDDYVETAGTIAASPGGSINLNGGVTINGGSVNLGEGILHVYKADSHIAGGSIAARSARFSHVTVLHTNGTLTATNWLSIYDTTYEFRGGTIAAGTKADPAAVKIGRDGDCLFAQTGGTLTVEGHTQVGADSEGRSLYSQSGGIHTTDSLWVGSYDELFATANYVLSHGELTVRDREGIGSSGPATFTQTGGTHTVAGTLEVGNEQYDELGNGTLILAGGSLVTGNLIVGVEPRPWRGATPHLSLAGSQAYLEVRDTFRLGHAALLTAVDGAAVHMTGSAFENHSTNEAALAGLENLTMIFEGGTDHWATFEVASEDLGAGPLGFLNNFALGSLLVGGAEPAMLRLEDAFDNGNRASFEALYVHDLVIGPGSSLDLNGLHLYYDGTFVGEGTVTGGVPAWVPEPATLAFVLLGSLLLVRRRNRL